MKLPETFKYKFKSRYADCKDDMIFTCTKLPSGDYMAKSVEYSKFVVYQKAAIEILNDTHEACILVRDKWDRLKERMIATE